MPTAEKESTGFEVEIYPEFELFFYRPALFLSIRLRIVTPIDQMTKCLPFSVEGGDLVMNYRIHSLKQVVLFLTVITFLGLVTIVRAPSFAESFDFGEKEAALSMTDPRYALGIIKPPINPVKAGHHLSLGKGNLQQQSIVQRELLQNIAYSDHTDRDGELDAG